LRGLLQLRPAPVNAGPKRFAALLALVFSLAIALALGFHRPTAALTVTLILGACASLEAFLGYCLGCKVYTLLHPIFGSKPSPVADTTQPPPNFGSIHE
jgi:hypothetical protein